ncbi:Oxidoreductase [Toensbergia leucococca]|nr:Oxidoreductase [Toensbergia leucococca]
MYKAAPRSLLRQSLPLLRRTPRQRLLSTAPPSQKSRSWKSSAARWGLAIGGIYYYNTSNVFAEEPAYSLAQPSDEGDTSLPTIESISSSRRKVSSSISSDTTLPSNSPLPQTPATTTAIPETAPSHDGPETPSEHEEEASQQGAFNEETGEINWDCPCLGGMAHGPCGEQFRAAFSCFVYSKDEPKGMDCIDNFKNMQDCFRLHPDIYGAELDSDDLEEPDIDSNTNAELQIAETLSTSPEATSAIQPIPPSSGFDKPRASSEGTNASHTNGATAQIAQDNVVQSESDELVPKAAHDATEAK